MPNLPAKVDNSGMKKLCSLIVCLAVSAVLIQYRVSTFKGADFKVTTWDALGYYLYLPSAFIYHDATQLRWLPGVEDKYKILQGGNYPATKEANGNYVFKYLGGVAILESPFFMAARATARKMGYADDGFSPPFQYAIVLGALLYCIVAVFILRRVLLWYFDDGVSAVTILLLCLGTNLVEYAAVDSAMSHGFIFFLYAAVLYTTAKWHRQPKAIWAILTGYIIGLATISRPTEAIMLLIPLLWGAHTKAAAKEKWQLVNQHKNHIYLAAAFGILGIAPQLVYWKISSGSVIYDVGSAWDFLTPHLKVLFGWEKGWFIYTPVTLFFVMGLFFVKRYPFRKSVLWFCLLNIYIIISWHEWRYAASYSTRALVQSYPVFALPFAALVDKVSKKRWRWLFYVAGAYLVFVNLFQVRQYISGVLHYDDMNRLYYSHIYLNAHPRPLDMSLLDRDEFLSAEDRYERQAVMTIGPEILHADANGTIIALDTALAIGKDKKEAWLKVEGDIKVNKGMWQSFLNADLKQGDSVKHSRVRLFNAISPEGRTNHYAFYVKVPPGYYSSRLNLYLGAYTELNAELERASVIVLTK